MKQLLLKLKVNKKELLIFFLILVIASFFRFYKIQDYFYFISDAGRDAREAYKIIYDHKLTLVGPRASVAGFFMGPFYFYLITMPLLVFKMNPIGLGYFCSTLGVLTVALVYFISRKFYDVKTALLVAAMYAVGNTVIVYSRMAWNPSPAPLFTVLLLISLYYYQTKSSSKSLLAAWVCLGLGMQLHYTFLYLFAPLVVVLFVINQNFGKTLKQILMGISIIVLLNLSLIVFDLRHHFITSLAFKEFLLGDKIGFSFLLFLGRYWQNTKQLMSLTLVNGFDGSIAAVSLLVFLGYFLFKKIKNYGLYLGVMIFISLFFLSLFKGTVQLYYFNFLLPLPFLFLGYVVHNLTKIKGSGLLLPVVFAIFFLTNLNNNLNLPKPSPTLQEIKEISESIINKVGENEKFNIAMFSSDPWHTAEEYRYFTYYFGKRAEAPENYEKIDKLYLIAVGEMKNPLEVRSQETDNFKPAKIENSWRINSVTVFQMIK